MELWNYEEPEIIDKVFATKISSVNTEANLNQKIETSH